MTHAPSAENGEVCICNLVEPLGKSQPTVSHHMKILGDAGREVSPQSHMGVCYFSTKSSFSR